jgi:CRP-like cAMP-binding protein
MSNTLDSRHLLRNRLLSVLPSEEFDVLRPHLEPVSFVRGDMLFQAGDRIRHVYFPNTGMVSLLSVTEQGHTVEVGFTGYEGLVGLPLMLGRDEMAYQALVQVAADAYRVEAGAVLKLFKQCGVFHDAALRFGYVVVKQISQTCVCNHFHTIEARLCRWLTVMVERAGSQQLSLTQEFLSHMLGVQRTSVGLIANNLQNKGVIRYRRGKIEIVDLDRLRQSACECYFSVRDEYEKFLKDKNFPIRSRK